MSHFAHHASVVRRVFVLAFFLLVAASVVLADPRRRNATMTLFKTPEGWRRTSVHNLTASRLAEEMLFDHYDRVHSMFPPERGFDVVYLHEMDILEDAMARARARMPHARFIAVPDFLKPWPSEPLQSSEWCTALPPTRFGRGYRSMCSFFYDRVWSLLTDYELVLRIDVDVVVYSFEWPDHPPKVSSAMYVKWDNQEVVNGMIGFFREKLGVPCMYDNWRYSAPYTNVFLLNVTWATTDPGLRRIFDSVEDSNCIMISRWGDLPLWGLTIHALNLGLWRLNISYFHGSHRKVVDESMPCYFRKPPCAS